MIMDRRTLLTLLGLSAAAAAGGCSSPAGPSVGGGPLKLWHNNGELRDLFAAQTSAFTQGGGPAVEIHYEPLTTIGKSLQLAWQSDQMPDLHVLAGLEVPVPVLQKQGWFQPMALGSAVERLPAGSQIEGIHVFDGKSYSFPITSARQYWAPVWYLGETVARYGLDPDQPPATWEEFRTACRAVQQASDGEVYGWLSKLGVGNRMGPEIEDLAQAAGWTGVGGIDLRTGEYAWHADEFVETVEFVHSLHTDGLMHPASLSLTGVQAQARWAAGASAYWFDGPWLPGYLRRDLPDLQDKLRVAPILVPTRQHQPQSYAPPAGGSFWLSAKSGRPAEASRLMTEFLTTKEFAIGVAESSAVPADLSVVAEADVHPAYQKLITWYGESVFLAPSPVVRNPAVAQVLAEMREIKPGYGDLVQGYFSGDVTDIRAAFRKLSTDLTAERARAIQKVTAAGDLRVSEDNWSFPDWQPRQDYPGTA